MGKGKGRKKQHARGDRRVAGFDEVAARNETFERKPTVKAPEEAAESSDESDDAEPAPAKVNRKKVVVSDEAEVREIGYEEETGIRAGLSRKQKDELDKAEAKKRYEKMHKEGKTDEAKADLARLAEVKERREKQRLDREVREKEEKEKEQGRAPERNAALREALGGDAARLRGARSKENKKKKDEKADKAEENATRRGVNDDALYIPYANLDVGADQKKSEPGDVDPYSMEDCKRREEDFM